MKVGFVYVGPIGDHGWSYQHDQGRLALEKHFGGKVQTTYVENVPEGADAERVIRKLASTGHEVIFTTSFGFMNPTVKVAKQFPKVTFEHATGYKRAKNLGTAGAMSPGMSRPASARQAKSAISHPFRSPRSSATSTRSCWVCRR